MRWTSPFSASDAEFSGTGMRLRLMECARLRVQDVDFACRQITVRCGKGGLGVQGPLDVL